MEREKEEEEENVMVGEWMIILLENITTEEELTVKEEVMMKEKVKSWKGMKVTLVVEGMMVVVVLGSPFTLPTIITVTLSSAVVATSSSTAFAFSTTISQSRR